MSKKVSFSTSSAAMFNNVNPYSQYPVVTGQNGVLTFYDDIGNVRVVDTFGQYISKSWNYDEAFPKTHSRFHIEDEREDEREDDPFLMIKDVEPKPLLIKKELSLEDHLNGVLRSITTGVIRIGEGVFTIEHPLFGCEEVEVEESTQVVEIINALKVLDKYI